MLSTTCSLDHQGIVSGTHDELEIGTVIDEVLLKLGQHKLAHSIVVKTMILNCLVSLAVAFICILCTLKPFQLKGYLVLESAHLILMMMFWGESLMRFMKPTLLNFS
jgi:hypothetical protein